jgi:hypothetical protein
MTTQETTLRQCLEVKLPPKSEEVLHTLRFHRTVRPLAPFANKMAQGREDSLISPPRLLSGLAAFPASHQAKCSDELFIAIDIIGTIGSEYNSSVRLKSY